MFGVLLYLVFGKNQLSLKEKARMSSVAEQYEKAMRSVPAAEPALPEHTDAKRVSDYLHRAAGAPVFTHTETTYLPVGEVYFDTLLAELEKAEKFIFMEYYIIAPGTMWNAIHEVLRRKAESGVDVRVMYDDFGCMYKLPEGYEDTLEAEGIRCCVFNRFIPILSVPLQQPRPPQDLCDRRECRLHGRDQLLGRLYQRGAALRATGLDAGVSCAARACTRSRRCFSPCGTTRAA